MEEQNGLTPTANPTQCYNRGCGKKYDPDSNTDNSCRHHPGVPVFHDALKGWSCCNKKCRDFTEFLNIPGCTFSKHSNIKPPEPEKQQKPSSPEEIVEVRAPVSAPKPRPPLDTALTTLKPLVSPSLNAPREGNVEENQSEEVSVGTMCKNGGCKVAYEGPQSNEGTCIYHPGVPVFHEGLKFWSCCQKRTTDFNAFLNQIGCENGNHKWKDSNCKKNVQCRWDYHQTGSFVVVSVYAKNYCPQSSFVKINPIRLHVYLKFLDGPEQTFELDVELQGLVDVEKSELSMYNTKIEVKLKKAEPRNWTKLEVKSLLDSKEKNREIGESQKQKTQVTNITAQVEDVDLSDL